MQVLRPCKFWAQATKRNKRNKRNKQDLFHTVDSAFEL